MIHERHFLLNIDVVPPHWHAAKTLRSHTVHQILISLLTLIVTLIVGCILTFQICLWHRFPAGMTKMAAHGRGLALSPVLCTVFCLILPPKTNNVWFASKSNSWFHGVHLYDSTFNWKCLKDLTKTWQKRPKSWLSETCWSCFTLWSVLLAVLAMFWDLTLTISDNLKQKGNVLDPFI